MISSKTVTPINISLDNAGINDLEINNRSIETCEPIQLRLFSRSSSENPRLTPPNPDLEMRVLTLRLFYRGIQMLENKGLIRIFAYRMQEVIS